jgi:dihydroorotate dehydrogenase
MERLPGTGLRQRKAWAGRERTPGGPGVETMIYELLKPLLFRLEAERAHDLVTGLLAAAARAPGALPLLRALYTWDDPILAVECAGLRFANPIGLAAGFDKRGVLAAPMAALGFGHVEVGTVTPRPQPGNPKPRMFRLPEDTALINRLGFNSEGMVAVARRLKRREGERKIGTGGDGVTAHRSPPIVHRPSSIVHRPPSSVPCPPPCILGVNIGKNRDTPLERAVEDYLAAFVALAPLADYVTVNISSPNTPGLRRLHERTALTDLLAALTGRNARLARPRPIFLKLSPDEPAARLDDVIAVALETGIAGLIAGNTTTARDGLRSPLRHEAGGLSGRPLAGRAREVIAYLHRATAGRLPVIGVGGVACAQDAYGHIRAGASLVQLYTGMIYCGPGLAGEIARGLAVLLRRDGFPTVAAAVGADIPASLV